MITPILVSIALGICPSHSAGCYSYPSGVITLDPQRVTPYVLAHELGHAYYFQVLTSKPAVNSPGVRDEEAYADVYAACVLGKGPLWLRTHGYRLHVGINRFKRICRGIS